MSNLKLHINYISADKIYNRVFFIEFNSVFLAFKSLFEIFKVLIKQ